MVVIYIDQSRWVALLRAQQAPERYPEHAAVLHELIDAVEAHAVEVPLSFAHYHETWHAHDWRRRHNLSELMKVLSGWRTIAPLQTATALEVDAALSGVPLTRDALFGHGANHAFAAQTGRFIMVQQLKGELYPSADALEPEVFQLLRREHPDHWEWLNLAGPPDDFPLKGWPTGDGLEFRPEHVRGDDWRDYEIDLRHRLEQANLTGRLHDALLLESLVTMIDAINNAAEKYNVDPVALLMPPIEGPRRFHQELPSRSVLVDLQYARLSERQYVPHQHDRLDVVAHAVAFAYCDVVLTERRLRDLARRARVSERFGTRVIQDLAELPALLSASA